MRLGSDPEVFLQDKKGNPVSADKLDDRTIYWVPVVQK